MALLEEEVAALPGVVVAASHDRVFLESVCSEVLDLDPAHVGVDGSGGRRFTGGYSDYLAAKQQARQRWEEQFAAQQDELAELRRTASGSAREVAHNRGPRDNDRFIHHFKGQNVARTVSRRVRDTERRIVTLERRQVPKPPAALTFRGTLGPRRAGHGVVVSVRDLVVHGRLDVPRLDVEAGDRLLVTGSNGSGKSTLLKVLSGQLSATTGTVTVSAARVGYLPQDVTFRRPDRSAQEVFDAGTGSPVRLTELGLLHPRDLARPVGELSVGQQRRLGLAVLVARAPDLLLLDEPTNHISLTLAEELEESLRSSTGTVVVASHDRWLRRRWDGEPLTLSPCAR
jgi:macrolide transport system ATP-binding/permease protein